MRSVGRPKKYNEELRNKTISVPVTLVSYIEDIMEVKNYSFNEVIIAMVTNSDKDLAIDMIDKMQSLQKSIKEAILTNTNLHKQLTKVKNVKFSLFSKLDDDPTITKFVKEYSFKIKDLKKRNIDIYSIIDIIYKYLEDLLLKNNTTIKRPKLTRLLIKREILKMR